MGNRWRLVVLMGMFALVTGCSSGGEGDTRQKPVGIEEDKQLAYARCMREQGVDMPDPGAEDGGGGHITSEFEPAFEEAAKACEHLRPPDGDPKPTEEELDAMRIQAKCLREHGMDVADPTAEKPYLDMFAVPYQGDPSKLLEECDMVEGAPK